MNFSQFFLNYPIATAGVGLVASPIIIHLINRMRFRKVRFAAMEFLLEAQQRNRRRLLLEQLLLLLLRILIVLGLVALIARLVLDSRLTVFSGEGQAHHVVLLDDSASMQNRVGDKVAFDEAKAVVKQLVAEGAQRPGTQTFSMLLLSKPDQALVSQQQVDDRLGEELDDKLGALPCTFRRLSLAEGIASAGEDLKKQRAVVKHLHVLSDFRKADWEDDPAVAQVVKDLSDAGITVNLIRTVGEQTANLGVTRLDADLQTAAVGVPVRLTVAVRNYGQQLAEDVRVTLSVDGEKLPLSVVFDKVEAGQEVAQVKDVTFHTAGLHRVKVAVENDALGTDNERFLSLDVPLQNNVLIVGNDVNGDAEQILRFALASDPALTGISPRIEPVNFLRTEPLSRFRAVYILNQADIPLDAVDKLEAYVRDGGGLVWFLGNQVQPASYNERLAKFAQDDSGNLVRSEPGLFPVPLDDARAQLAHDGPTATAPDLVLVEHPTTEYIAGDEGQLLSGVRIEQYVPVAEGWDRDDAARNDGVKTVGYLRNREPVLFDHSFGRGKVVTFLSSAGPPWTNLHTQEVLAYVPLILQIQKYVAKPDPVQRQREVGVPIELDLPALDYAPTVYFLPPGSGTTRTVEYELERVSAPKVEPDVVDPEAPPETPAESSPNDDRLRGVYTATDQPGIYGYRMQPRVKTLPGEGAFAYNVSPKEGATALVDSERLRRLVGETKNVFVHEYGDTDFIGAGVDPGRDVRNYLIYALLALLVAEQALAYRLSYHPDAVPAAA